MARRRRVRRNIREDQLVTWSVQVSRWVSAHFTIVVGGAVALVVVAAGLVVASNARRSAARRAARQVSAALASLQRGEYAGAKTAFGQIAREFSGRTAAMALYFRADAELRQGEFQAALEDLDAYLERAGDFPQMRAAALYGRGVCYEGLGDARRAAEAFAAFLDAVEPEDPRYARAAFQAGEAWRRAGDADRALEYFRLAIAHAGGPLKQRAEVAASLLGG